MKAYLIRINGKYIHHTAYTQNFAYSIEIIIILNQGEFSGALHHRMRAPCEILCSVRDIWNLYATYVWPQCEYAKNLFLLQYSTYYYICCMRHIRHFMSVRA